MAVAMAVGIGACAQDDTEEAVVIDLDQLPLQGEAHYAQVEYPVDSCKSLGMAFGDSLVASLQAPQTSEEAEPAREGAQDGDSREGEDDTSGARASWLNQIKHVNTLSSALTHSGLSCGPQELLEAAETKLPASVRATIYVGVPAPGVVRAELTSYEAWRASMLDIFRVITSPPDHLADSP